MGIIEEGKGKVKEAVGDLTDNEALQQEGRAQKEDTKASALEKRQQAAQRAKAS